MTRGKADRTAKLTRLIGLRVSNSFYKRMQEIMANSNCRTVTELARAILYREEILWMHKDATLESTALELAGITKELNAMRNKTNQMSHRFHLADPPNQERIHAVKVAEEYKKVGIKVD